MSFSDPTPDKYHRPRRIGECRPVGRCRPAVQGCRPCRASIRRRQRWLTRSRQPRNCGSAFPAGPGPSIRVAAPMASSNRNCVTLGREIGLSPTQTLKIARQLGATHLHKATDPVGDLLCDHILRIQSDPARAESWSRLVKLATLPSSPQPSWNQAHELATLTREFRFVKPTKGARKEEAAEARRRRQAKAKAEAQKRRADAAATRERLRQAMTKRRHCRACGNDFDSDSPQHGCRQSKQLAKRRSVSTTAAEPKRSQREKQDSDGVQPISEHDKRPEYRWREIPSGHPDSGRRR